MTSTSSSQAAIEIQITRPVRCTRSRYFLCARCIRQVDQPGILICRLETAVQQAEDWLRIFRGLQTEIQTYF